MTLFAVIKSKIEDTILIFKNTAWIGCRAKLRNVVEYAQDEETDLGITTVGILKEFTGSLIVKSSLVSRFKQFEQKLILARNGDSESDMTFISLKASCVTRLKRRDSVVAKRMMMMCAYLTSWFKSYTQRRTDYRYSTQSWVTFLGTIVCVVVAFVPVIYVLPNARQERLFAIAIVESTRNTNFIVSGGFRISALEGS